MPTQRSNPDDKTDLKVINKDDYDSEKAPAPKASPAKKTSSRAKVQKLPDFTPYLSKLNEVPVLKFEEEEKSVTVQKWQGQLILDFEDAIGLFCNGKPLPQSTRARVLTTPTKTILQLPTQDQFGYRLNPFAAFVLIENIEVIRAWLKS